MTTIAVVIPTVEQRSEELTRCLHSIGAQQRPPDELYVARGYAGPVQALAAAWERTTADWIAVTDDDAAPRCDWLARLEQHLDDSTLGAVGGRIVNVVGGRPTGRTFDRAPVAALSYYGRTRSRLHDAPRQHVICGAAFLPGSNMCFHRSALPSIDLALGLGMAPGFELALCLEVARRGYAVRFDSELVVEHRPARRPRPLDREDAARRAYEYSRNLAYTLLRWLPWPRKLAFGFYFLLIGQATSPGLLAAPLYCRSRTSRQILAASWHGKFEGARIAFLAGKPA